MKILIIGSGGREHALVWHLSNSKKATKIFCAPGNVGIAQLCEVVPIASTNLMSLLRFAKVNTIDLTFVGPESPLIRGIVDLFEKNNLQIIGPSKKAARIEGSKIFAKRLMQKYEIPTAKFRIFTDFQKVLIYLKKQTFPQVIKADGDCLGKGVLVAKNFNEGREFVGKLMVAKVFKKAGDRVIIEECLEGQEVSFIVASDGNNFVSFLPSQDHKRIFDNDKGSNTGGMGAYAPIPFLDKKIVNIIEEKIVKKTLSALRKENSLYKGILYPGIILTKDGPKVLEFNCRFGDPETQPILSLLKTDLVEIFRGIQTKSLNKLKLSWHKGSAVCVVLSSQGYPGKYEIGKKIGGLKNYKNVNTFHSGTKSVNGKILTNGGRVLGITARGISLKQAIKNAYANITKKAIFFPGMHYRSDIGQKGLNKKLWK